MRFAIGIHNHQPVGNFDHVLEDAYQRAYWPFLDTFARHDGLKLNLHNSGPVWEFVRARHPEYMKLVGRLVSSGRLELLTGGYFEPILPVIPDEDKVGQIRKLTDFLDAEFGPAPRGLWLAERVWEPHLPRALAAAGVRYCITDDAHFRAAGLPAEALGGYYLTEELGATVAVFPIHRRLRQAIPFEAVGDALRILEEVGETGGDPLVLFADDGEKFGVWPGTYDSVHVRGWLGEFFEALERHAPRIRSVTLGETIASRPPEGRVYLPAASYPELMGWALPPDAARLADRLREKLRFEGLLDRYEGQLTGATWRSFLARYPESNRLHKRMLAVARRVHSGVRPDPEALDHLWKAQCNCGYWHGTFGGLYFPHLRSALYSNLIAADTVLERGRASGWGTLELEDVDADGADEVVASTETLAAYFAPAAGGALQELDFKPAAANLLDTLARRREAYHPDGLAYDAHPRDSFLDHFLPPGARLDPAPDDLSDFATGRWAAGVPEHGRRLEFTLSREGTVVTAHGARAVAVAKQFAVEKRRAEVRAVYRIEDRAGASGAAPERLEARFAVELNFGGGLAGHTPEERFVTIDGSAPPDRGLGARQEHALVSEVAIHDRWRGLAIRLAAEPRADVWRYPVESWSRSVTGPERLFQCVCVTLVWDVALAPGAVKQLSIRLVVEGIPRC
jgi:alpha-amylase